MADKSTSSDESPLYAVTLGETMVFRDPSVPLGFEQLALRRQTYKQITAHPDTFNMSDWEQVFYDLGHVLDENSCRTTRCIAGWGQFLARGEVTMASFTRPVVEVDAVALFGLTEEEYYGPGNEHGDEDFALFYLPDDPAVERLRELCYFEPGE